MKLAEEDLSLETWLNEFDVWVTPSLTDIRDTARFRRELAFITESLDALDIPLNGFSGVVPITADSIAAQCIDLVLGKVVSATSGADLEGIANGTLNSFACLLFLVTGKSDNNNKCQFPLYLKNQLEWASLPTRNRRKKTAVEFRNEPIPRVLKSENYMQRVADLLIYSAQPNGLVSFEQQQLARQLVAVFVGFLLSDQASLNQLVGIGKSYFSLKHAGQDAEALLKPLVAFQVRGSVSASGGHEPERILRARLTEWGFRARSDFNLTDVVLNPGTGDLQETEREAENEEDEEAEVKKKTRAYDFVIPYQVEGWASRLFIQSQFYAGDSGSVSHKNVDQTDTSRNNAILLCRTRWPDKPPIFIEYVDGAGYSASLNRDLKSLLYKETTHSFFQIRSAPIRLRREIQAIGFLAPLEIEHALIMRDHNLSRAKEFLLDQGYEQCEIERSIEVATDSGILVRNDYGEVIMSPNRVELARRYLLLDIIAEIGQVFNTPVDLVGVVLVPGFGPYFGTKLDDLGNHIQENLSHIWQGIGIFNTDLAWLSHERFIINR